MQLILSLLSVCPVDCDWLLSLIDFGIALSHFHGSSYFSRLELRKKFCFLKKKKKKIMSYVVHEVQVQSECDLKEVSQIF